MKTWRLASPYTSVGIYIGGENRGCPQPNLTASWFQGVVAQGWKTIATWVGPQAPCSSSSDSTQITPDPYWALLTGLAEGDKAADAALALGLPGNSAIYYDMESYSRSGVCADLAHDRAQLHQRVGTGAQQAGILRRLLQQPVLRRRRPRGVVR